MPITTAMRRLHRMRLMDIAVESLIAGTTLEKSGLI